LKDEKLFEAETLAAPQQSGAGSPTSQPLTREADGRYVFRGEIGRGGLGRVWVAHDTHTGRDVAIKELLDGGAGVSHGGAPTESGRRFLLEARVTGQLEHPSIVPVYEIGERADGTLYYAMRRVQGLSLSAAIARADGLSARAGLLPRYRDVCQAIAYAHNRGVVHRDIKPDNVMLGDFGETVVLDWGLAKVKGREDDKRDELCAGLSRLREEEGARTLAGVTMGTPFYMPPEQALGEISEVDERSDIYALGAVLYEILTGRPPFDGQNAMEVIRHLLFQPLQPVRDVCREAPPELAAIAEKALRKTKSERYSSAAALARDVEAYMSGQRVAAYEYSTIELVRLFARRHRAKVIAAAVVLVALVASVVIVSVFYAREHAARIAERTARDEAITARQRLQTALELESKERRRAAFHTASAQMDKALALGRERRYPEARIFSAAALLNNPAHEKSPIFAAEFATEYPSARSLRARSAAMLGLVRALPSLRLLETVRVEPSWEPLALTPAGGGLFAAGNAKGQIALTAVRSAHSPRELVAHSGATVAGDFVPDGSEFVSAGEDGWLRVWQVTSGEKRRELRAPSVTLVRCSPNGKLFATATRDGELVVRDLETLESRRKTKLAGRVFALSWSPDARHLAVVLGDKSLILVDANDGALRRLPSTPLGWHAAEYSPDGKILATADWGKSITLWQADTLRPEAVLVGHDGSVYSFGYSPDGRFLLSGGFDRRLVIWDLATRRSLVALTAHDERIRRIVRLPSGNQFATMSWDRSVKLWELDAKEPPAVGEGHGDVIRDLALSPNGELLLSGSSDKTARLWDTRTLKSRQVLSGHTEAVQVVAFAPDGARVATGSADRSVTLWGAGQGERLRSFSGHDGTVTGLTFLENGRTLASADAGGSVRLWNADTGELMRTLRVQAGYCWGLTSSGDGSRFAAGGLDKTVRLFDAKGNAVATLEGHDDWTSGASFSPDGRSAATSGKDAVALIWNLETRKAERRLVGHESWVNRVTYSRDGRLLASASDDHTLRLWDASTGEPLLVFDTKDGGEAVALANDRLLFGDGPVLHSMPYDLSILTADPRGLFESAQRSVGLTLNGVVMTTGSAR